MKVLHTVQSLSRQGAGVFTFLYSLSRHQQKLSGDVAVVGFGKAESECERALWHPIPAYTVRSLGPRTFPIAPSLGKILECLSPQLIHCHGLWSYQSLAVRKFCKSAKVPYVVSCHGMLEPWAWNHHAWKKRPIWRLWEERFLREAAALHATSEMEAENLRIQGLRVPIIIVPCGVEVDNSEAACLRHKSCKEQVRRILFLSRIHPKKGLITLIEAWRRLRPQGWKVIVAGPDDRGHERFIRQTLKEYSLEEDFVFTGPVYGVEKWQLYRSCDLFVLPTRSENFGLVVAEAMACGLPVITTKAAPWHILPIRRCGWWIESGVTPLCNALSDAIAQSEEQRRETGSRGKQFVEEYLRWPGIAADMNSAYAWLQGLSSRPSYVK